MNNNRIQEFFRKGTGDRIIWTIVIFIAICSIFAVYSTGSKLNDYHKESLWFLLTEHVFYLAVGFLIMYIFQFIDYRWFKRLAKIGLIVGVFLLIATLAFGVVEGGSKRSISILGRKVQTIHFIELCTVVYLSSWIAKAKENINDIKHKFIPMCLYIFLFCLFIMSQKTSASLILGVTCVVLLFVSQLKIKYFFGTFGIIMIVGLLGLSVLLSDAVNPKTDNAFFRRIGTMKVRVESFLHSDNTHKDIITTEAAIASSSLLPRPGGNIHGNSVQESYSDYIFAFFVEEYGIFAGIFLVFLYLSLFYRVIITARTISTSFGAYLAIGIGFLIVFQAMTHICVCLGIFPATGETLPLFSKGGISILTTSFSVGIVLSISREAKEEIRKRKEESILLKQQINSKGGKNE